MDDIAFRFCKTRDMFPMITAITTDPKMFIVNTYSFWYVVFGSTPSPISGSGSIFQSPVWRMVPDGVLIASALGSGMEWVSVI